MSIRWQTLLSRIRQLQFPEPLRIDAPAVEKSWDALVGLTVELAKQETESPDAGAPMSPETAVSLSNAYFRMSGNLLELTNRGQESKEIRSMRRALATMEEAFQSSGIECRDLTGQEYDAGRLDFEQIGEAQAVPGIEKTIVGRSERPAVFLRGKLIQTAKGLVHRPEDRR